MICKKCSEAADQLDFDLHSQCDNFTKITDPQPGNSVGLYCDCQHKGIINENTEASTTGSS